MEVDEHGQVKREIGFNSSGLVVYRCPDKRETRRSYKRGFFDLASVDITEPNDLTADEFEIQWKLADSHLG